MNAQLWYRHAMLNRLQSLTLLGAIGGFMALLGWLLWGLPGLIGLLIAAMGLLLFNPVARPQLILRMYRANRLTAWEAPHLQAERGRGSAARAPRSLAEMAYQWLVALNQAEQVWNLGGAGCSAPAFSESPVSKIQDLPPGA